MSAPERQVRFRRGDATGLPFRGGAFDACVSQEAWLHIENKPAVVAECRRVLRPGGEARGRPLQAPRPETRRPTALGYSGG